jgi:hypothetical protein
MKYFLIYIAILCSNAAVFAQIKAVTDTGDEVILYKDGRWAYVAKDTLTAATITTNPSKFKKSSEASFLAKSTRVPVGVWLDPKVWTFQKAPGHDAAEFEINNDDAGLYGLVITENLELPLESLANIAIDNARAAAPDIQIINKEYRNVNGVNVLMMRMTGTIQDILFSYYGYYYATPRGAVQFLVYSSKENVDTHISTIENLLNGIVELE